MLICYFLHSNGSTAYGRCLWPFWSIPSYTAWYFPLSYYPGRFNILIVVRTWKMGVSHEEGEIHLTGRLEGRLLVATPFLCWGAVLETCVLAVFPRVMAVASSFCHLQQAWVAVGTSQVFCAPQLHEPVTREGSWYSHFPASVVHQEVPTALLHFPFSCLLFATSVLGGGCSQPAHGVQQICSEDELSFHGIPCTRLCNAELRSPMTSLGKRCSSAGRQEAVSVPHTHTVFLMLTKSKQMALGCVKPILRNASS